MLNCLIVLFFWWNSSDPKGKFSFDAIIINIKGPRKAVFGCKGMLKTDPIMKVLCIT